MSESPCKGCDGSGCSVDRTNEKLKILDFQVHDIRSKIFESACMHGASSSEHMDLHLAELDKHEESCEDEACKALHPKLRTAITHFKRANDACLPDASEREDAAGSITL